MYQDCPYCVQAKASCYAILRRAPAKEAATGIHFLETLDLLKGLSFPAKHAGLQQRTDQMSPALLAAQMNRPLPEPERTFPEILKGARL